MVHLIIKVPTTQRRMPYTIIFSGTTFGGYNFAKNPNSIAEKSYVFKIPVAPKVATNHLPTPLGAIGVSLNGVPFLINMLVPINL